MRSNVLLKTDKQLYSKKRHLCVSSLSIRNMLALPTFIATVALQDIRHGGIDYDKTNSTRLFGTCCIRNKPERLTETPVGSVRDPSLVPR